MLTKHLCSKQKLTQQSIELTVKKARWRKRWTRDTVFFVGGFTIAIIGLEVYAMMLHKGVSIEYQKEGVTISWLPKTVKRFNSEIEKQAKRYNIDANAVAIIMTLESGGYTKANSGVAHGLMQVTPPTAGDIAKRHLKQPTKTYDLFEPKTSIEFGVAYLAHLRRTLCDTADSSAGCVEIIAAGYNGGPGAAIELIKGRGIKANETLIYSRNAFNMWREKSASTSPTFERWKAAGGQSLIDKAMKE